MTVQGSVCLFVLFWPLYWLSLYSRLLIACIVLSIDFEKAFDTISWKFKKKCLSFFNFGESFQQWIKVFFTDITSCVLNTGWTTQIFSVSRGVRQGCPTRRMYIIPYPLTQCILIHIRKVRRYQMDSQKP